MNGVDRLITREDDQRINNAILSFPAGDPFIKTTLETFLVESLRFFQFGINFFLRSVLGQKCLNDDASLKFLQTRTKVPSKKHFDLNDKKN